MKLWNSDIPVDHQEKTDQCNISHLVIFVIFSGWESWYMSDSYIQIYIHQVSPS